MQHDDLYYIDKVKNGDTRSFSYIVEKYKDIVFSVALKVLKNHDEAEEMAQESFIKAYNSLHTFRGKSKFSTWMYSITYNHCISQVRKKKYETGSLDNVQVADDPDNFGFEKFNDETRKKYLQSALKKLPEEDYTLLILFYYEDQSVGEISGVMNLSESNTKVKLHRARKKLYTILQETLKDEIHSLL